jgi:predicted RNase H-like nuclease (RuvC/YqgF family)
MADRKMKSETVYSYQKKIKDLEERNKELADKLYNFRTSIIEIFDGVTDVKDQAVDKNWILKRMRRCFQEL